MGLDYVAVRGSVKNGRTPVVDSRFARTNPGFCFYRLSMTHH